MNVAIFSGVQRPFPPGWTKETIIAIFGPGDPDSSKGLTGARARALDSNCDPGWNKDPR